MAPQFVTLNDPVCLEVRGADADAFLHGQLSRAMTGVSRDDAPLAGWADARGRVRAIVRVIRHPERWLLVTPRDGAEALVKKLRMFVLRAQVSIAPAPDLAVAALLGQGGPWLAQWNVPADLAPNRAVRHGDMTVVRASSSYWQMLGPRDALIAVGKELPTTTEAAVGLAEIALGIPAVTPAIADRFVAQMLNLDLLDAVAFDKGCYPGQEIIARVHNLGGVKRRARRYASDSTPPPVGTAVNNGDLEVGEVVRSASAAAGCELLAVVDHAAAASVLRCRGAELRELPLPFEVPRD